MVIKSRLPMSKSKIWICWIITKTQLSHSCTIHNEHYRSLITKGFLNLIRCHLNMQRQMYLDNRLIPRARFNNISLWDNPWVKLSYLKIFSHNFKKVWIWRNNRKVTWLKIWLITILIKIKSLNILWIGHKKNTNHSVSSSHLDKLLITCTSNYIDLTIINEHNGENDNSYKDV